MSRNSLHRPRRNRAVWNCPATYTRLLPNPYSPCPHLNTHYKRCPRAERLRLPSDQSSSRPLHGRSPDKSRHALLQGSRLRISAPVEGHTYVADLVLAGESQQSDERRLKTNAPFKDSTVVTTGEHPTTNGGHGSPLPSLRMVEHFWWTGLPHTEIISRLFHVLSEARGCRKVGIDVEHPLSRTTPIGTGVAVFLRNRPGPSIPSPSSYPNIPACLLRHSCGGRACPCEGRGIYLRRRRGRGAPSLRSGDRLVALG